VGKPTYNFNLQTSHVGHSFLKCEAPLVKRIKGLGRYQLVIYE